ncbi:hypothetical protein FBZ86_13810 [Gluconacetobacter diazotrophicus]|nr:hypothetical protein FBZ86_13810 [Gluconacetobacter diazotrophicus]
MCWDSEDHIFNSWLRKSLHDQFGHVVDEPIPEIIKEQIHKFNSDSSSGKMDDT